MQPVAAPTLTRLSAGRSRLRPFAPPAALALMTAALLVVVPPVGEFPVDDDWGYARIVQSLVQRGELEVTPWTSAFGVAQAYWGGLFVRLFGFSFLALRASTLVLAAAGVLACYLLLRELFDPWRALLGALALLFNPLYVFLSYSFMTDVPFLSLALWALFCYVRALRARRPQLGWLAVASALAGGAYLVRQVGIALPLAALGGLLVSGGWRAARRPGPLTALIGPFLPAALLGAYLAAQPAALQQKPLSPSLAFWAEQGPGLVGIALARLVGTCTTLGLFALPLSLGLLVNRPAAGLSGRQRVLAGGLLAVLAGGLVVRSAALRQSPFFPHLRDVLTRRGFMVSDGLYERTSPTAIVIPDVGLALVTGVALVGGVLLVLALVAACSEEAIRGPASVPVFFGLLTIGLSLVYYNFYDRYLLPALPGAVLVAGLATRRLRWGRLLALEGVAFLAAWSIWWEQDYLERQAAVWRAGMALVERGVSAEEIDGGYEWNGWFRGGAVIAAAAERTREDETGLQFGDVVNSGLHMEKAPWVLTFTLPTEPPPRRVSIVVPYGHGQQVLGVRRN